ncbi:NADPH:quinone oxidoreductase family protein [Paraferrimonas sp. SM1919]|uniref:NADPH:quinone oxidoreductase family protein n=1 Tax=Paraferrimonas sp. SM1919 TaxID=2662263 RepID=UPI0013D771FB|nr:NADPH:quinone oxidoreductase family protein [Paraferrimonas sp. SM1919]
MKALVCEQYGTVETLKLQSQTLAELQAGEVLLDIKAAGLNFPDALTIAGLYQVKPPLPFIPGIECAGVVAKVGEGVSNVKVGDRVIAVTQLGAFAEQVICKANILLPMADNMSFEQAAGFCITYATSYYALKQRAKLQAGETVLVLGAAGGVGVTAIQIAKLMGAKVIAAASTDEKLNFAKEVGADECINYSTENLKERIKALTCGKGVDVVYDPVGGDYSEQAYRAIAWYGRYLVIGFAAGDIPKLSLNLPLLKAGDILGVYWGGWAMRDPKGSNQNFIELLALVAQGKLKPLTNQVFDFKDYEQAFNCLTKRQAKGKVILKM